MNTNTLIPVFAGELSGSSVQLVDARLLHTFLEVATQFKDWIVRRIEEYEFIDGQDFCSILSKSKGRPLKDYHLTIDMAKELSMVEKTSKGKQARRYFIDMERVAQYGLKQLPESKTKQALTGGLTLEMQDTIKALVKSRAEELPKDKQASAIIKQWSAIKKKFGCTYKEVSPDNFVNIISLITRLPVEGELLAKEPVNNSITITLAPLEPGKTRRWLISQMTTEAAMFHPINSDKEVMSMEDAINRLVKEGYIVVKKADIIGKLEA